MAGNAPAKHRKSKAVNVGAQQIAAVYAKAFLGASEKAGKTDTLVEELAAVSALLEQFPKLQSVFSSALVGPEEKAKLLDRVFASRVSPTLLDFLKVVSRHGRLDIVPAIEQEVSRLYDELRGRVRVELQTATPLANGITEGLVASFRKLFGGEPKLDSTVDPALIGGLMLRVGDTVYDGSIARQLSQVREQMITRSIHEIQSRRDRFRHSGGN